LTSIAGVFDFAAGDGFCLPRDGLAGAGSLRFAFGVRFLDFRPGDLRCRRRRWLLLAAGHGLAGEFVFAFDVLFLDLDLGGFRLRRRRRFARTGRHRAGAGANGLHFGFALLLLAFARRVLRLHCRRRDGLAGRARTGVGGVDLAFAALGPGFERRRLRVRRR
jgi:hypothetical protein